MLQNNITKKQQKILLLLYRFRFLNRLQIQKLLNHQTPIRINTWLKDLTEKGYINKIFKRSWTENTVPAKYFLSLEGIRFLKTQPECRKEYLKKLYREKNRSEVFINRSLFIADRYIQFLGTPDNKPSQFFTRQDYAPDSLMSEIKPDFIILKNKKQCHMYQLFPKDMPRYAVRKRIEQYMTFFTDGEGADIHAHFYLICETEPLHKYLTRYIERLLEDESIDIKIKVITNEQLRNQT